jgi:hypothetical protein
MEADIATFPIVSEAKWRKANETCPHHFGLFRAFPCFSGELLGGVSVFIDLLKKIVNISATICLSQLLSVLKMMMR